MVKPVVSGKTEATRQQVSWGIALELENVAYAGRRWLYEAYERVLKDKEIVLTPVLFSRFALRSTMEKSLEGILTAVGKKKVSAEKMAQDIQAQVAHEWEKSSLRFDAAIGALLNEAVKANIMIGAITLLPADMAQRLVDRSGLKDILILHVIAGNAQGHFTPEGWLKLTKAMGLMPHRCCALVAGSAAFHSALMAGMRSVVIPDAITAHQDFGGAHLVMEDPQELRLKDLKALMQPCAFR